MENRIEIYSYGKVWRIERKIYSIGNFHLPAPVNPHDLMSFVGALLVIQIITNIIPLLDGLPNFARYFLIPYLISKYLMKKKLDGKNPISYIYGILEYLFTSKGTYIEIFEKHRDQVQYIQHDWKCGRGRYLST